MDPALFEKLLESVRQAGAIIRGESRGSREYLAERDPRTGKISVRLAYESPEVIANERPMRRADRLPAAAA